MYPHNIKKDVSSHILKWLDYDIHPNKISDSVVIISSHTSIYDFLIGLCLYYAYYNDYILYISIYKDIEVYLTPLFSFIEQNIKFIPIDVDRRLMQTDRIEKIVENNSSRYILYISPEGTHKCTDNIHKGYWYISQRLHIPIVFMGIDYYLKRIIFEREREPKVLWNEEKEKFIESCSKYIPLYPELCHWTKDFYTMEPPIQ